MANRSPLSAADFQDLVGIDNRTLDRLRAYLNLLIRWQQRINLVGTGTLDDPWRRHMLDSAQLVPLLPKGTDLRVVDLGSGAGFPGLVLAILSPARVELVESDARKCAFLAEAARITGVRSVIHNRRIETLPPLGADVTTARALAPLPALLAMAARVLAPQGIGLFLKGRSVEAELTESARTWKMRVTRQPSRSDDSGVILKLEDIARRHAQ